MLMTIDLDAAAFGRAAGLFEQEPERVERELRSLTQKRAKLAKEALQRATPVSHPEGDEPEHEPHMASLWHQETTGPSESIVFNDASYSSFLFSGTSAHTIRPRDRATASGRPPALRFYAGGSAVFTPEVHHPGTLPDPRLLRALESQLGKAEDDLFDYGIHAVEQLAADLEGAA